MKACAVLLHDDARHDVLEGLIDGLKRLEDTLHYTTRPVVDALTIVHLLAEDGVNGLTGHRQRESDSEGEEGLLCSGESLCVCWCGLVRSFV